MSNRIRLISVRLTLLATVALVGAGLGISAREARAQGGCENDGCSRVCFMGTCSGECYDNPGSNKACDMQGGDCAVSGCNPY